MQMLDSDKVSLELAAQYLGLRPEALGAMESAGWITPIAHVGSIPFYRGADVKRLRSAVPPETNETKVQRLIRDQRVAIQVRLERSTSELQVLQNSCQHPNATKTSKSDTGNWDRSQDSYWRECVCPDCGKRWTEPQ